MDLATIAIILGGLTIGSALMVILSKHPVKSVLFLVLTFFLITGNYVLLNAQFIAVVNIIVYAGAIMVLFLFVLMLLNLKKETEPVTSLWAKLAGSIAAGSLFIVLIAAVRDTLLIRPTITESSVDAGLVENLGQLLFTKYVLPFEVSSILLLSAMVGAVLLAKRQKQIIE
jgi:NADH-quinone oxidoreductase subunit J